MFAALSVALIEGPPRDERLADASPGYSRRDDEHLMKRVAARDRVAFAELYDQFSRPMFALVLRVVHCRVEAEDILQDAFASLWNRAETYRAERGSPFSWITAIVRNKAIDVVRERSRHFELMDMSLRLKHDEAEPATATDSLGAADSQRLVRAALAKLSGDESRVIELAFFDGLTHREISAALGQPLGTIKARIRRGLLKLRPILRRGEIRPQRMVA